MGFAAGLALGCGSVVVEPGQSAGSATGSGGSTGLGGAGGSGFGGAGGAISSTVASSSTTVSSGGGGGPACLADTTLFVEIDGDVMDHLDASCVPTGSVLYNTGPVPPPPPGPPPLPPGYLTLFGCTTSSSDLGLIIGALSSQWPGPATVTGASIELHKGGGKYVTHPNMSDGTLVVTTFEATGGVIEGTFSGTLKTSWSSGGAPVISIKGAFRVCHTADSFTV